MRVYEEDIEIPTHAGQRGLISYFADEVRSRIDAGRLPVRFVVTEMTPRHYRCELGVIEGLREKDIEHSSSIFDFHARRSENTTRFNAVMLVPTGIGCALGGHAGDANAAATLLASVCDTLITHPNVVNASDLNELPDNALYVEGSIVTRLLMGQVGLQPVRSNRVLVVMDQHPDSIFMDAVTNSVSAARATFGLRCPSVVALDPPIEMHSLYARSGRAVGEVEQMEGLLKVIDQLRGEYDALALATRIHMPRSYHTDYYRERGAMINPWGGVEAIFTHAISTLYDIPAAHAPMEESQEIANQDVGVVDPRMAAEVISNAYFSCVLKGLQRSPRIVRTSVDERSPDALTAADISCLVIPDKVLGLPTLAALEQGIVVIAVRENDNIMRNDLAELPWAPGQLIYVDNYLEAVGVMTALRSGVDPASVRRPLAETICETERWT